MYAPARREYLNPVFFGFYTALAALFLFGALLYVAYSIFSQGRGIHFLMLLMLIQVAPFIIAFGRQQYNYLSFILFNHLVCYSIPKFNQMKTIYKVDELFPEAVLAIKQLTICTLVMAGAYYLFRYVLFYSYKEKEKYQMLSLNRTQLLIVTIYVIFVPACLNYIPSWFLTIHFAAVAADMVLLLCANTPGNERLAFILRFCVFLSAFWYFFQTGALTMVGNLAGYVFIASCLQRRYKRLIIPIILTILGSTIQTVKMPFRSAITQDRNMPLLERVELLGTLIYADYIEGEETAEYFDEDLEADAKLENVDNMLHGFARLGDDSMERVLAWTPSRIPFWNGESYESIPFMFIPRFLWLDKPSRHIWNRFGRTYGYLSTDDDVTSVAVNYFAEAYMNFGYGGMYLCAIFMGLLIATIERVSYYFLRGYFYFTFMAFLMPVMVYATDLGSIVQSVLIISSVLVLLRSQFLKMALKDEYS